MASKKECLQRLKDTYPQVNKDILQGIVDDLDAIKAKSPDSISYRRNVNRYFKEQVKNARTRVESSLRVAEIVEEETDRIITNFGKNPVDGVSSIFGGSLRRTPGGKRNIFNEHQVLSGRVKRIISDSLSKEDLALARSGNLDKEIYIAKYQMSRGQDVTVSDPARRIAEALTKGYNLSHQNLVQAGSTRNYIDGYMKRVYDEGKVSSVTFEEFKRDIVPHIDYERTFRYQADDQPYVDEVLKEMYDNIRRGVHNVGPIAGIDSKYLEIKSVGTLDKRLSKSRTIHFKTGEGEFEFMNKYGKGNALSNFVKAVEQDARAAATISRLGPNPRQTYETIKQNVANNLDPDQVQKFRNSLNMMDDLYQNTTQGFSVGSSQLAKNGAAARSLGSMGALGGATLTAFPMDLGSSIINYQNITGKGLFESTYKVMKSVGQNLSKKNRKKLYERMGIYTDNVLGSHWDRFSSEEREIGKISKLQDIFFKVNLLELETDVLKTANYDLFSAEMGDYVGLGYESLPISYKNTLESYGISNADWDIIRTATETVAGQTRVTPYAIEQLDIDAKLKNDLSLKLSGMLNSEAEFTSVPTATIRETSRFRGRFDPDSYMGQLVYMASQFMPIASRGGKVAIQFANGSTDAAKQTFRESLTSKPFLKRMAQAMLTMGTFGAISEMSKSLAKNQEPNFEDPEFYVRSLVKGGAMGIYGDFLFAEYNEHYRSLSGDILGPTIGVGEDLATIFAGMIRGEDKSAKAFKTLWNNAPGTDLFYLKGVLDYYIHDEIVDTLSPGYKRRKRNILRREGIDSFIE